MDYIYALSLSVKKTLLISALLMDDMHTVEMSKIIDCLLLQSFPWDEGFPRSMRSESFVLLYSVHVCIIL